MLKAETGQYAVSSTRRSRVPEVVDRARDERARVARAVRIGVSIVGGVGE